MIHLRGIIVCSLTHFLSDGNVNSVKRFYSQKTRRKNIISIFRAPKYNFWCFVRGYISTVIDTFLCLSHKPIFASVLKKGLLQKITAFSVLVSVLAITSLAESNISQIKRKVTLNVLPGHTESTLWHNPSAALIQDVNEGGVRQSFTKRNAAYFDGSIPEPEVLYIENRTTEDTQIENASPIQGLGEGGSQSAEGADVTTTDETVSDVDDSVDSNSVSEVSSGDENSESSESDDHSEPSSNNSSEQNESSSDSDSESSIEDVSMNFFFKNRVTTPMLLVHESLIQSISDSEEMVTESVTEVAEEVVPATETETQISEQVEVVSTEADENPVEVLEISDTVGVYDENEITESQAPAVESDVVEIEEVAYVAQDTTSAIVFNDFTLPRLESGQFIRNMQLRMSLAGITNLAQDEHIPSVEVEYTLGDDVWVSAGTVLLDGEISNALNGGYFLFALPKIQNASDLDSFSVRVLYKGDTEVLEGLYIDSLWLEIDTEMFDRDLLRERLSPKQAEHFEMPTMYEFVSDSLDFTREELPRFALKYESQRNAAIRFIRDLFGRDLAKIEEVVFAHASGERIHVSPQIDVAEDGFITIQLTEEDTEKMQPGAYSVEITVDEGGKEFTDSFSFQYGVLAINSDKTEYEVGATTTIMIGAVSQSGNTVCNAELALYIIDPLEYISEVPVYASGECNGNNVTDVPDYSASYIPTIPGTYEMYVERIDENGNVLGHTSDTFIVEEDQVLSIHRDGPTRINPQYTYPMTITVLTDDAFEGELVEYVPKDFIITDTDAVITEVDDMQELRWTLDIPRNASYTFSYTFDAPDISPYLYTLGPAHIVDEHDAVVVSEFVPSKGEKYVQESIEIPLDSIDEFVVDSEVTPEDSVSSDTDVETTEESQIDSSSAVLPDVSETEVETDNPSEVDVTPLQGATSTEEIVPTVERKVKKVFAEHRAWEIASDATGSMIVFWTNGASIPSGWTCISCNPGDTFYNRFPIGSNTYGTTGGVPTTTHGASGSVNASTAANGESNSGSFVSIVSHSHTITPTIGSTTTLPAYRQLRVIQNNSAGDPGTIPAGAILMFDGTLPSGWAEYTPINGRYPYGQNTIVSGGSNTHTHSVTGTTGAASGSSYNSRTGGTQVTSAANTHTHTISSTTPFVNHEPPHIEVIFATSSVSTSTPINAIAMWSDTAPAGWLDRSSDVTKPFYNRYIKGASTYGTTGGAETHTHGDMSITSSAAIGTDNARQGTASANSTHTHVVDVTSFTTASNTPPYVTVLFAKFYGYIPVFDQNAYRWYVNTNAATPTDVWPVGAEEVEENQPIDSSLVPVKNGDVVRLRMALNVTNSTTTGESFKLQYGTTTDVCTAVSIWTDVGSATSSAKWIGYNNAGPADGVTLTSGLLADTDELQSYEEQNSTVVIPNEIGIGENGEWDFVLKQNNAEAGTQYCFRMVEQDGTEMFSYTQYPQLVTNEAPQAPTLLKLFDNEKVGTTTPIFEFTAVDSESNDISYEIQIDDDRAFGSVNVSQNTISHGDQFTNLNTPSDKDPYTNGETIQFILPSALTNGVTYYWRVRAQDPTGSNTQSEWSEIYSFTIDTSVTVSTWFQTTEEQFETDTLTGVEALVTDLTQLISGSTTGTTTSSQIDFLKGTIGNAWGSLSWTDNETVGDIKYRVQYFDDATSDWLLVPDADLSGNSAGFDTSPVSLLTLDVDAYRLIRLVAVFTNSGGTPTLSDWTIAWGYRIDTPTINAPFANEKVGTTTPTFEFYTDDPQSDSLIYEVQWSTSYAFTASTTRTSNVHSGFVNSEDGLDTSPFNSGDVIQFTVQPADALTNGTTYWWRVRARDPLGSNEYSFRTSPRSFTVDTSVTVSTWFQTTQSQFDIDTLSGAVSQAAGSVTVATTSVETLIAYAEGTQTTPRYRVWNGSSWGAEANALDVGAAMTWVVTKSAPAENEYIMATVGTDADVNVQVYRNGSWGNLQEVTASIANTTMRGFDVAYEQLSGDALVVYCDGDADPSYYVWNGSSWTSGGAIGLTAGNTCGWVKLISDPVSDEIIAVTRDTSGITYEARVWNGSSWGNSATWGSMQASQANHEGIAAVYEDSGNQAVVAVSNGTGSSFSWRAWNGTTWSAAASVTLGDDFESGTLVADDGTDNMLLCYHDEDGDIGVVRWTGAAWAGQTELETALTNATAQFNDRPVECAYEVGGARDGYGMVAYTDATNLRYRSWNGAAWAAEASIATIQDGPRVQMRRTGDNLLQVISYDHTNDRYDYSYWNGSAWSAIQTLETDAAAGATPYKEPFMIAPKNPVTVATVVGDPQINFYDGSGPYWQEMSWTDTESGGSSILYQVEYYDGDSWELIPDSLIPGNSTGTTTSPINLTNVLPASTYSIIRPVANMTCNLGVCPVLSDWTITWSAGITVSGTAKAYDQTTNLTSGTVAIAINGVLQTGKTGVISAGAWSIANVNAAPDDIITVFINGANEANEAVAVARYDGVGNMSGLELMERHLNLGSDDVNTLVFTNTDLGLYDYTNDEDLFFNATGTALSVCVENECKDAEMRIKAGSQFSPSGLFTTHDFENNGTFLAGGNTITISGSWDNNATTTMATSTVVFSATSTSETIDGTGALNNTFYNVTFGSIASTATWAPITTLDVDNNLTVSYGTLSRNGVQITVGGNLSNGAQGLWSGISTTTFDGSGTRTWSDANATLQNVGRVVIDGTTKVVQLAGNVKAQSILIGADDTLDASVSHYDITVLESWINNGTFTPRNGEVFMSATSLSHIITAGGDTFYDLTFNGSGGSWSFTEPTLTVHNDLKVTAGTVTMPTGTTTLAGSWNSVGGTFAHNNSTIYFTSNSAETIAASGTPFTNNFYTATFNGGGSWTFLDTNATTSNDIRILSGTVTFPSGVLAIGNTLTNTSGSFAHNNGTVAFTSSGSVSIDTNASFNNVLFSGSGSWSFVDTSVTMLGDISVISGTVTLPSNTLTLGGSFANASTVVANNGTVLFNSLDAGETINLGSSSLYNMTFNGSLGGWTITAPATTTNNFTLATTSTFVLASGQTLSVGGVFTNATQNASTTWTGSVLSLEVGSYALNAKTHTGDTYGTLRIKSGADMQMWNSSAVSYDVQSNASLYSQDHAGVDGDLYVFGSYERTSGNEYWSYATDFDGVALLASTSRQVDVRFADGASAYIAGSHFEVLGASGATTTVQNQGSGSYTLESRASTSTLSYYDFEDLGLTGLTLSGTGTILSLADGAFDVGVSSGTGLTVSSTTIDANPGMQIYRVEFSTSTAISATNVVQTGVPTSYWWFRESTGNIDGESFDADTGDPGSIRWDDSLLSITISGTVFSDNGVTPMGNPVCDNVTPVIRVVVQGGTAYTGSCDSSDGTYSIPGVVIVGDPVITTYLNTNGGARGSIITRTPTSDITNFDIYQNRVITRHEDVEPLSITKMAVYDFDNDNDIAFTAATSSLVVFSGTELRVASGTTFFADGDITIHAHASSTVFDGSLYIDNNAVFTGYATSTYIIGGSFTMETGATFTAASSSVVMNATTTGKTITTDATQEIGFYNLEFAGVGGAWNINGDIEALQDIDVTQGTVSGTGDITVRNGSLSGNGLLSMGSGTTTLEQTNVLGGTTPWTFGNLVLGNGLVTGTTTRASSATTTILGVLTIATGHYLDADSSLWNLSGTGTVFNEFGTFVEDTSTVRYSGAGATNILSTNYYNLELKALAGAPTYTATGLGIVVANDLTIGGATTTSVTFNTFDPVLDVNGNMLIESTGTFIGSASASTTIAGNWTNDGVFTSSNGTVVFDGGVTPSIAAGNSSFGNMVIDGSGSFTVTEHATTTGTFTLTNASAFTLASGQSLAVGGVFTNTQGGAVTTWTGSTLFLYGGGNYAINASTTNDTYGRLSVASGTQIRMWNSDANTYDINASGSLYSQDHAEVNGDLYVYGAYTKTSGTDYWSYATDFDGTDISGAPRSADVYVANGGSVVYTGGALSVIGVSTASTTIQNQGSGTYTLRIGGTASTTFAYYKLRNLDSSGLTFSGTPTVINLSYGDFEVAQNGASAVTVGGTVITQNQARTFTNILFATSTGVSSAYNVTATGTTVSSWRFTNHTGAIDGELYDVDPNGDPGYIVWDDSAALITISGVVYSDEGTTPYAGCDGVDQFVTLRVAGLTTYTAPCTNGTGSYSISNVAFSPGDSLIVYLDGEATFAATVTEDPVSNINDMDLYGSRVIVRHEGSNPLSIADMAVWDSSDDADIPFTAIDSTPDTLTLPANRKLIVWTSKEFEPNGNVTVTGGGGGASHDGTLELYANAIFDATGSETHTVGGSLILGSNASLDDDTSTFVFTTGGAGRTVDTNNYELYNVVFNGSGSWSVTNTTLDVANDLTISQGAVTLPSATTTISGSLSVTGGSFNANGGTIVFDSSAAETILARNSNFNALTIQGTGSFTMLGTNATATADVQILSGTFTSATGTLSIGGDFINHSVFTHGSGVLRFTSASASVLTASSSDLYGVTFAGNGPYVFTDTDVALLGSLIIENGAVTLATGTMSIAGSFRNFGGNFDHASGTILFNSSDTGEFITAGGSLFNEVMFGSATGGWTMTDNATTTSNFTLSTASSFTLSSGSRLAVQGVFTNLVGGVATTWTGSTLAIYTGSTYTINTKSAGGDTYNNLIISSSTALRAWDSAATVSIADAGSSFYSQDNAGVAGTLSIYGNYVRSAGADYWSYATDFDGASLSGSERQVFVYMAENATTTLTGGTLAIVGANGFDTTITNQGSGTYALRILGGTLNALYYSISNMNVSGLVLSGTSVITSLSEGNFTLSVNGGSLITLSSTTLNYNTGLVSVNNSFATTTAITGTNIAVIGTTPSAWTFTGHTGNFDGEVFDDDGVDACGSIRWDDSACLLSQQSAYRFRNDDGGEGVPDSEWYDQDWSKRARVTVTNTDAVSYTNAAIEVVVPYDADMQADFDDIRFTTSDGTTLINHFIETYTASTDALVWVEIPLLATSTETEIYMYYGNGAVADASATSTFNVSDMFEDGNISEYAGDTGEFSISGSGAYERTYRIVASDPANGKTDVGGMYNNSAVVRQGETIRYFQYIDATETGDESCTAFGTQNQTQNYAVCLELFGVDRISLAQDVLHRDTSGTVLASTTVTYSTGWYEVEVDWDTDDSIFVSLYQDNVLIATTSAIDSSYTSGGIGYTLWTYHGGWDAYTSRPLLQTDPTYVFGAEQVSGGASWLAARNTAATGVIPGETVRARFLIENTGTIVTDQNYEIEFAAKGSAPSCEAVDYAEYVEVPNIASCGTSDLCMDTSSFVTNLSATTDVLGGNGDFIAGQFVEDPSNNTGNITIDNAEYTELEYAITATENATESIYCLRVTNEGTDLDSYTRVAELVLLFAPNITSLSLNGGQDIVLIAGATTTVYATGTVSDLNGYTDLVGATSTIFRSGVGESCSADNNSCYISGNSSCSFVDCSGNTCDISCTADIYYHADATDVGTYAAETWRGLMAVEDVGGSIATATAPSIDLLTLRAISVPDSINYGTLEANADTGSYNASTTVENIGNDSIDISIQGSDLTDGISSVIPVSEQIFATSTFTYSSCTYCSQLSILGTNIEVNLNKPTTISSAVTEEVYWGIAVPFGVAGRPHQGVNIFSAIAD